MLGSVLVALGQLNAFVRGRMPFHASCRSMAPRAQGAIVPDTLHHWGCMKRNVSGVCIMAACHNWPQVADAWFLSALAVGAFAAFVAGCLVVSQLAAPWSGAHIAGGVPGSRARDRCRAWRAGAFFGLTFCGVLEYRPCAGRVLGVYDDPLWMMCSFLGRVCLLFCSLCGVVHLGRRFARPMCWLLC